MANTITEKSKKGRKRTSVPSKKMSKKRSPKSTTIVKKNSTKTTKTKSKKKASKSGHKPKTRKTTRDSGVGMSAKEFDKFCKEYEEEKRIEKERNTLHVNPSTRIFAYWVHFVGIRVFWFIVWCIFMYFLLTSGCETIIYE